jgi:hypothetical protein
LRRLAEQVSAANEYYVEQLYTRLRQGLPRSGGGSPSCVSLSLSPCVLMVGVLCRVLFPADASPTDGSALSARMVVGMRPSRFVSHSFRCLTRPPDLLEERTLLRRLLERRLFDGGLAEEPVDRLQRDDKIASLLRTEAVQFVPLWSAAMHMLRRVRLSVSVCALGLMVVARRRPARLHCPSPAHRRSPHDALIPPLLLLLLLLLPLLRPRSRRRCPVRARAMQSGSATNRVRRQPVRAFF